MGSLTVDIYHTLFEEKIPSHSITITLQPLLSTSSLMSFYSPSLFPSPSLNHPSLLPSPTQISLSYTFIKVGVDEAAPQFLDDVNGLQVPRALEPHNGLHGQLGEVVLVVGQQLGGERGAGNIQQVLLELHWVVAIGEEGGNNEDKHATLKLY